MKIRIKLGELLEREGISHREFSRQTGIRHPTISSMCNNEIKQIPIDNLAKICDKLNCEISDVLKLVPEE